MKVTTRLLFLLYPILTFSQNNPIPQKNPPDTVAISAKALHQTNLQQAYLNRFAAYLDWSEHLPSPPTTAFIQFIKQNTPLARKLREQWLYDLIRKRDWKTFLHYYQASDDTGLQCHQQLARYYLGEQISALDAAKRLWLTPKSRPPACNALFDLLLKSPSFDEHLIDERIRLALRDHNPNLAVYLLKQYKPPHLQDAQLLLSIEQQPTRIRSLDKKGIHSEFYLFGLHKLIFKNMPLAIQYWQKAQLNDSQNQAFISYVALHKAVHNQPDASQWFAKLRPAYYNDDLIEWRIRDALKQHRWEDVRRLSQLNSHKDEAIWQYWLARALDAQGHTLEAKKIYTNLASHKNYYYGFLASMRLHQPWKVNQQTLPIQTQHIRAYKPITDTIKQLYLKHDTRQANQLLQDFISELPSNEKAAILYWVLTDLKWYGKAVTLSDNDDLRAYTSLRFPLLYRSWIQKMAKQYQLSPAFIYAVIRQESGFYETIGSSAGAQGIMQIMPDTAKMISRFAHIPYRNAAELSSYDKNIQMGTAYLHHLAILFNQQPVLMLAAYNAGPRQVHRWLAHNEQQEVDIWIESIPWRETRNYIKNIVMFYLIYQDILKEPTNYPRLLKPVEG